MADAIQFWFDLADPWSWVATGEVRRLAQDAGRVLEWHPVRLPPATAYGNPARDAVAEADLQREAGRRGVPFRTTVSDEACLEAMAAIRALPVADRGPLAERALHDVWRADQAPESAAPAAELDPATNEAAAAGVFSTPSVVVDGAVFWGADRMHMARQAAGLPGGREPFPVAANPAAPVTWFHDFSSPFSYLASTQVKRLEAETGITLERVPILLGALFRGIGTPMVPMSTFTPMRQRWQLGDLHRWAEWWGVPFNFPSGFPLRTVTALRVALIEPNATDAMYRAAWVEDRNIGDDAVLTSVLDEAGFDGAALVAGTQDDAVKERLKANTTRAQSRGVCGVPSFELAGSLIWGQDRLDTVAWLLSQQ